MRNSKVSKCFISSILVALLGFGCAHNPPPDTIAPVIAQEEKPKNVKVTIKKIENGLEFDLTANGVNDNAATDFAGKAIQSISISEKSMDKMLFEEEEKPKNVKKTIIKNVNLKKQAETFRYSMIIQSQLSQIKDCNTNPYYGGDVDGLFQAESKKALENFQKDKSIKKIPFSHENAQKILQQIITATASVN